MTYTFKNKNGYQYDVEYVASCDNEALELFAKGMRFHSVEQMQKCMFGVVAVKVKGWEMLEKMKKGDLVEFESDLQVESGPCAGAVLDVTEGLVEMGYGYTSSMIFMKSSLKLSRVTTGAKSGKTLWMFE